MISEEDRGQPSLELLDHRRSSWNFSWNYCIEKEILVKMYPADAKSLQSCLTLCDPKDGSPPGSSVPGILQGRTMEWVAIFFSNACCMLSCFSRVRLCATLWTAAHQAPLSTGFSRQEYWSGLPFPSPKTYPIYFQIQKMVQEE